MKKSILKRIFAILLSSAIMFSACASIPISTFSVSAAETASNNIPSAVTGLKFTSQTNSITLSWNESEGASGYYIYLKSSKEPYNFYGYATVEGGKNTSWTNENLSSGRIYEFRVLPYKTVDSKIYKGDYAEISTITIPATVRKVIVSDITDTSLMLKWGAVTNADGYCIYRRFESESEPNLIQTINGSQTTQWTDTELNSGTACDYAVKAYKEFNGEKIYSDSVWVSGSTNPSAVTNLKISSRSADKITLNWFAANGITSYDIYQESKKTPGTFARVGTVDANTTTYVREGLSSGTEYTFRVFPIKSYQDKTYKGTYAEIKTSTLPGDVRKIMASDIGETSITVNWGAVNGANGYQIYRGLRQRKIIGVLKLYRIHLLKNGRIITLNQEKIIIMP